MSLNKVCPCWDFHTEITKIKQTVIEKPGSVSPLHWIPVQLTRMVLHSSTVAPTTASDTGNGLTKTCPERCDSWVRNPAHPPLPRHTIGGPLPLGMGLLPSPPFAERDKGVVTGGMASQALSQHRNMHTE